MIEKRDIIIEEYERRTKALVLRRIHKREIEHQKKLFKKRIMKRKFSIGDIIFLLIKPSTGTRKLARVTRIKSKFIDVDIIFGDNFFNLQLHKKYYMMGKAKGEESKNFTKELEQIEARKFAEAL
jgi:hypothetical protein